MATRNAAPMTSARKTSGSKTTAKKAAAKKPATKKAAAKKSVAKPKLLSGGNPQIAKGDGAAAVEAYIAAMPGWKQDVGRRLDALVTQAVPQVRKAVRWNSPFYGMPIDCPGEKSWFLSFHCFAKYVKIAFFQGAALNPPPPGTSRQADVRYLDIHEGEVIDDKQFSAWVNQASRLPGKRM